MDSRMIDVAIGLALVFALSSLVVSTLHEIWVSLRKSRGDTLLLALCSLSGDDAVTQGQFRRRMSSRRPSAFVQALLAHPLLASQVLGQQTGNKMPSYLSPELVVRALLNQLDLLYNNGQRPAKPQLWVNAVVAGRAAQAGAKAGPSQALVDSLAALLPGADADWPAYEQRLCAWYDTVVERAGGWFRRDTQLRLMVIGVAVAAALNINPLVIGPRLWNDGPLRQAFVKGAEEATKAYSAATAASAADAAASGPAASAADAARQAAAAASSVASNIAVITAALKPAAALAAAKRQAAEPSKLPQSAQSLEVDQALASFKAQLFSAAESRPAHPSLNGTAQQVEAALAELLQLEDLVKLRRNSVRDSDYPRATFNATVVIERRIQQMTETYLPQPATPGLDGGTSSLHRTARAALERLRDALIGERLALLPTDAGKSRPPGARICDEHSDPDTRRLCDQIDGLNAVATSALPIGWYWANWPGCGRDCLTRNRAAQPAATVAPVASAASAAAPNSYRDKLASSQASCAAPTASAPGSCAADLKSAYYQERAGLLAQKANGDEGLSRPWNDPAFWSVTGWLIAIAGWLITGIAATLGAPFWFDLLGKLIKLRGSGSKPDDGAAGGGKTDAGPGSRTVLAAPSGPVPGGAAGAGAPAASDRVNPDEARLGTAQVLQIQRVLEPNGGLSTGRFDVETRNAIARWQTSLMQDASGELSAEQIARLLPPAPVPSSSPAASPLALKGRTPLRSNGTVNVLSDDDVRSLYGNIATVPDTSDPKVRGLVKVIEAGLPGGVQRNLVDFSHAVLDATVANPPLVLKVHEHALAHFKAVFDAIKQAEVDGRIKLGGRIRTCAGTLCERHIGHDPAKPLSRHTWGIAIDLNAEANGYDIQPPAAGQPDSVREFVTIFNAYGFAWGGDFSQQKDGMHFELALRDPTAPVQPIA